MTSSQQDLSTAVKEANASCPDSPGTTPAADQPSHSEETGARGTPTWLIEKFHSALGGRFNVDPSSGAEQTPIAETCYTKSDDGLSKQWGSDEATVWLNPPFDNWNAWAEKAQRELTSPRVDYIVFLMGSLSLSADWFHDFFVPHIDELCVLSDRLAFDPHEEKANQPLLLGTLGRTPDEIESVFQDLGAVYTPQRAIATFDEFTDGGLTPTEALERSSYWKEKPEGGYASDTTWYLDRDKADLIRSPHAETCSRPNT